MQELQVELQLLVVEQMSSVEDLATLRQVSRMWRDSVDASFITNWAQRLSVGEQFAASSNAGLWILEQCANGRGSLYILHSFFVFNSVSVLYFS